MKFAVSYSGGKDSTLALHRFLQDPSNECMALFTTTNQNIGSWFHDINIEILNAVANSLNIPFVQAIVNTEQYNEMFEDCLFKLKKEYNIEVVIFGDIDIIAHHQWCSERCTNVGLQAVFPLWNENRFSIVKEFIDLGYTAIIKRVSKKELPSSILGQTLSYQLLDEFKQYNIDLCGENGEYHTLVIDGPLFNNKVEVTLLDINETENTYSLNIALNK